jgi:hypothetical protein
MACECECADLLGSRSPSRLKICLSCDTVLPLTEHFRLFVHCCCLYLSERRNDTVSHMHLPCRLAQDRSWVLRHLGTFHPTDAHCCAVTRDGGRGSCLCWSLFLPPSGL